MVMAYLFVVPAQEYFKAIVKILKEDVKVDNTVYVTTNKPYRYLMNLLKEEKIKTDNIFFIDCISNQVSEPVEDAKNCVFIESPQNVTSIGIALNEAVKLLPGKKTVLFDSLSTLLLYNNEDLVGRFSNFVVNRMRLGDVNTILIVLEADVDRKIIRVIESFVDELKRDTT